MVAYVRPIDPHVHLRGQEYPKDFLGQGLSDAVTVGLSALLEMPNPVPQLTTEKIIGDRIQQVDSKKQSIRGLFHGINIGLTNDLNQVRAALELVGTHPRVTADKTFYTHSTGNMGILDEQIQRDIWKLKAEIGYRGVSMGHFEDEKQFTGEFDPANPISHSWCQNEAAELIQVDRQLGFAVDSGFEGTFYVCHISNPETVDLLQRETNKDRKFRIIKECTFHHIFLNYGDYSVHGNRVKMNPPIRSEDHQQALLRRVIDGKIDILGTDHAGHPVEAKDSDNPPSGIPALLFWPRAIELLREEGIQEELLEDITFNNANELFGLNRPRELFEYVKPEPKKYGRYFNHFDREREQLGLWEFYGFNPFSNKEEFRSK